MCSELKPLPRGLCGMELRQVHGQDASPACTHPLPNPLACFLPQSLLSLNIPYVYFTYLDYLLFSFFLYGVRTLQGQGVLNILIAVRGLLRCSVNIVEGINVVRHPLGRSGQAATPLLSCSQQSFCLPLSSQVSAVLWPGDWLKRFFCFGLGFFFSFSLFLNILLPYFIQCFSLSFGASFSVFLSFSFSVSSPLFFSLSLSPVPPPPNKILMLSHETV